MNKVNEMLKAWQEKMPLRATFVLSCLGTAVAAVVAMFALYLLLLGVGVYDNIATALDLKYNSPLVLVPLWVMVAVGALCVIVGMLMYFHKYKRTKGKLSSFGEALAPVLSQETDREG